MPNGLAEFPDVPTLGETCAIAAWFPVVSIICACDAKTPLLIVGHQSVMTCPACKKNFMIGRIHLDPRTSIAHLAIVNVHEQVIGSV